MKSVRITSVIMGFVIFVAACSGSNSVVPSMTCKISRLVDECTAVPTIQDGSLRIKRSGQFVLTGLYSACFHDENVNMYGKYQGSKHRNTLRIELLATKIKGLKSSKFPATIAIVTLDRASLKGVINDVWATIRSPGQNDGQSEAEIVCKPD